MAKLKLPEPRLLCLNWPYRAKLGIEDAASDVDYYFGFGGDTMVFFPGDVGEFAEAGILEGVFTQRIDGIAFNLSAEVMVAGSVEMQVVDSQYLPIEPTDHCIASNLGRKLRWYVGSGSRARVRIETWKDGSGMARQFIADLDVTLQDGEVVADVLAVCSGYLEGLRRSYSPDPTVPIRVDDSSARPFLFTIIALTASNQEGDTLVQFPPLWVADAETISFGQLEALSAAMDCSIAAPADFPRIVRYPNVHGEPNLKTFLQSTHGPQSRGYYSPFVMPGAQMLREPLTACAIGPGGMMIGGRLQTDGPSKLIVSESTDGGRNWKRICNLSNAIAINIPNSYIAALWYQGSTRYGLIARNDGVPLFRVFRINADGSASMVYNPQKFGGGERYVLVDVDARNPGEVLTLVLDYDGQQYLHSTRTSFVDSGESSLEVLNQTTYGAVYQQPDSDYWMAGNGDYIKLSSDKGLTWENRPAAGIGAYASLPPLASIVAITTLPRQGYLMVVFALDSSNTLRAFSSPDSGMSWSEVSSLVSNDWIPGRTRLQLTGPSLTKLLCTGFENTETRYKSPTNALVTYRSSINIYQRRSYQGVTLVVGENNGSVGAWPYSCCSTAWISLDDGWSYSPAGNLGFVEVSPQAVMNLPDAAARLGLSGWTMALSNVLGGAIDAQEALLQPFELMRADDVVLYFRGRTGGMESLLLPALSGKLEQEITRTVAETSLLVSGPARQALYEERSTGWMPQRKARALMRQLGPSTQAYILEAGSVRPVILDVKKLSIETKPGLSAIIIRWREVNV